MKEIEARQEEPVSPVLTSAVAPTPPAAARPAESPQADGGMANGTNLHLFGDLGYRATDDKSVPNTFFLGSLDRMSAELRELVGQFKYETTENDKEGDSQVSQPR